MHQLDINDVIGIVLIFVYIHFPMIACYKLITIKILMQTQQERASLDLIYEYS